MKSWLFTCWDRNAGATEIARMAAEIALACDAGWEHAQAQMSQGFCLVWLGHAEEGSALMERCIGPADRDADPEWRLDARLGLAIGYWMAGRSSDALTLGRETYALAAQFGLDRAYHESGLANLIERLVELGQGDEAEELIGGYLASDPAEDRPVGLAELQLAELLRRRGDVPAARTHLDTALRLLSAVELPWELAVLSAASAEQALAEDSPAQAATLVRDGLNANWDVDTMHFVAMLCALGSRAELRMASLAAAAGAPDAQVLAARARLLASGLRARLPAARSAVTPRTAGFLDEVDADRAEPGTQAALEARERAVRTWEQLGSLPRACEARVRLAVEQVANGLPSTEVAATLEQTRTMAASCGALAAAADATRLATRLGIRLRGDGTAAQDRTAHIYPRLTRRENQVLDLLAEGATNRRIAQTLFISEKTVSVHVSNILAKLGAANRTEAAAKARATEPNATHGQPRDQIRHETSS